MRTLVTGHDGYIGSVLVPLLRAAGHDVIGLDTGLYADGVLGPVPPRCPRCGSTCATSSPNTCRGLDAVMHLAALCNDPIGNLNPDLTYDINHRVDGAPGRGGQGSRRRPVPVLVVVLALRRRARRRARSTRRPASRRSPRTASRRSSPSRTWPELADDDFSPVYLRNATAYGFSPRLRGDLVVNDLIAHALLTGEVRLLSDGTAWRPLVHVEDIAAAFLALLEAPRERGAQPGLQRRADQRELPDPRRGRDRPRRGDRFHGHLRRRRLRRLPQLPGQLRPDRRRGARLPSSSGRCARASSSWSRSTSGTG